MLLKTIKVMETKGRLTNCHRPEEAGNKTTKCNVASWTGSWNVKRTSMEK